MFRKSVAATFALVVLLTTATPATAAAARPDRSPGCGPGSIDGELPIAPEGFVAVQTFELTADCRLLEGAVEIVPTDSLSAFEAGGGGIFSSVSDAVRLDGDVSIQGTGSGCCWRAYAVQRTWDCCGIKMNEYWTEFSWSNCSGGVCSPYIRSYSGQDGGKWATELFTCGPGWSRVSSDHYLYRSSGGLGYTSVTLSGHQGYSYKGRFDCGGKDYYNSYWNSITGQATGNWSCSYTYSWKKSLGFSHQAWCGTGPYGEK